MLPVAPVSGRPVLVMVGVTSAVVTVASVVVVAPVSAVVVTSVVVVAPVSAVVVTSAVVVSIAPVVAVTSAVVVSIAPVVAVTSAVVVSIAPVVAVVWAAGLRPTCAPALCTTVRPRISKAANANKVPAATRRMFFFSRFNMVNTMLLSRHTVCTKRAQSGARSVKRTNQNRMPCASAQSAFPSPPPITQRATAAAP